MTMLLGVKLGFMFFLCWSFSKPGQCQESCDPDFDTCEDGEECHPLDEICIVDPPRAARPNVWISDAPDCDKQPGDCAFFQFEFNMSHPRGEPVEEWCDTGLKHRCLSRLPHQTNPTPLNQLQVVTYNIDERRFTISKDGQRERSCRIPHKLIEMFPSVDVIAFQEVFMGGCWSDDDDLSLRDLLSMHGFTHNTQTIDSEDEAIENGGTFISSRWPIIVEDSHVFESYYFGEGDALSAKGVVYAQIQKMVNDSVRVYNVFATHMQAWDDTEGHDTVREEQAEEMYEFADSKALPNNQPVIFTGDFNADRNVKPWHMDRITEILNATQPETKGILNVTYDPFTNDFTNATYPENPRSWLDYVMYSNGHQIPTNASMEAQPVTSTNAVDMCWCSNCVSLDNYVYPNDQDCDEIRQFQHLSDHHAVVGSFIFE